MRGKGTEPVLEPPASPLREVLRRAEGVRRDNISTLARQAVADAVGRHYPAEVEHYRPKTTAETVSMVGDKVAESMTVMFDRIASDVRTRAQEVVDKALEAQKQAEKFCADLTRIGEWHASGLKKAADECVGLLELIDSQKKLFEKPPNTGTLVELEKSNGAGN